MNGGAFTDCGSNRTIMGDGTSSPLFFIRYEQSNGNIVLKHKSNGGTNGGYPTLAGAVEGINELDFTWTSNDTSGWKFTLNGTDTIATYRSNGPASNQNMALFCNINGSKVCDPAAIRVYYLKVYKPGNNCVRNLVPCYRKSDNVRGLYDLVTGEFLTNSATSGDDFIAGPDVAANLAKISISGYPRDDIDVPGQSLPNHEYHSSTNMVFTAPSSTVIIDENFRMTCTGWKYYSVDSGIRTLVSTNDATNVCVFNYDFIPDGDNLLVWQWKLEYKTPSANAYAHTTMSPADQWIEYGDEVTLTSTPDAGCANYEWVWNNVYSDKNTNSVTVTVTDYITKRPEVSYPKLYVSKNGDDNYDGTTLATAKATFAAAYAEAASGTTIYFDAGEWTIGKRTVNEAISFISLNGPEVTSIIKNSSSNPFISLNRSESVMSGFTLTSTACTSDYGGRWMDLKGGMLTNCVFRGNYFNNDSGASRSLITMENATIVDCLFIGNEIIGSRAAVCLANGFIDRCRFIANKGQNSCDSYGATALTGYQSEATVRNTLIACNTNTSTAAAVFFGGSGGLTTMENCTIVGNVTLGSDIKPAGIGKVTEQDALYGYLRNCLIVDNWNRSIETNMAALHTYKYNVATTEHMDRVKSAGPRLDEVPQFKNPAAYDFRVSSGPVINGGQYQSWMDTAKDLLGKPRVKRVKDGVHYVDIGCYEKPYAAPALILGLR